MAVILPRDSGEGWWKGRLTRRVTVVAEKSMRPAPRPPSSALRMVPPPRYRGAGSPMRPEKEKHCHEQKQREVVAEGMAGAA